MFSAGAEVDCLPAVPAHVLSPVHSISSRPPSRTSHDDTKTGLSRSASFTYVPGAQQAIPEAGIKRTFSENVLASSSEVSMKPNGPVHSANKQVFRRASRKIKKKLSAPKVTVSSEDSLSIGSIPRSNTHNSDGAGRPKTPSRSVVDTFRSLARKPWISTASRSPSPSSKHIRDGESSRARSPTKSASALSSAESIKPPLPAAAHVSPRSSRLLEEELPQPPEIKHVVRSTTPQSDGNTRPLHVIPGKNKSETSLNRLSRTSSSFSLRSKASSDSLRFSLMKVPPIPSSVSTDRLSAASAELNKRKDPLWNAFRTLEADFQKFQSKSSSLKANVIRTCLLPFFTRYADHPSNKTLRAEDLDRRVVILNKWWTGLLEILNGRNNQMISGTDRPAFLDGLTGIMTRYEWRIPPFTSAISSDTPRSIRPSIQKSQSTTSFESSGSDILADSIHQNVRNMYVQNLLSQMALVVEKMSLRTAPASLVAFSGKACAYAFFFCPGVADILVKLWHIPQEIVRRIFSELGIPRSTNLGDLSKEIALHFPPPLRSLSVISQTALTKHLDRKVTTPSGAAYIGWYGPWINRWTGRDSDLFFAFAKHYHMLVVDFLPASSCMDKRSRACIPGLIPLHAQILNVLENTIYRQTHQTQAEHMASTTVNNLSSPDAAAPLAMMTTNATRSMAENRLIMLLRDLLADANPDHAALRELYVESFDDIVKAAARKVSLYNNDACFALCDFMEEVLTIMARYHQTHEETPILDWPFWLQVYRVMMTSHNSLTEIRLLSFLYSTWNILCSDDGRQRDLCLGWLLEPHFFNQHFNHWSPMVRHYFLRLLCWRVARYDGDASSLDIEILEALANRLNSSWARFLYLRAEAEMLGSALPSSAPCSPAPARRLIIIRTDSQPIPPSMANSFDKFLTPGALNQTSPYKRHSSLLNNIPPADSPTQNKKRWSILKTFLGTPGNSRPGEVTPPGGEETAPLDPSIFDSLSIRTSPEEKPRPTTPPHQAFSFKFSLEWLDRPTWPGKNRQLSAPTLPAPAQILLQIQRGIPSEIKPLKPAAEDLRTAKYSGRALAEWALIVIECQNFFERRKEEGVPNNRLVETPTLGIESFRVYG